MHSDSLMYTFSQIDNPLTGSFYRNFTFPLYRSYLDICQPSGSALAIGVDFFNQPVGLAMAILFPDMNAEILSIYIDISHRQRGVGTKLFSHLLESLSGKGCKTVEITYVTGKVSTQAIERLLEKFNWNTPQTRMLLCKCNRQMLQAPWVRVNYKLAPEYVIFPWLEITKQERKQLQEEQQTRPWIPSQLNPFDHEKDLEPLNSFGLRRHNIVVGWIITHRHSFNTIRYTCGYIRPDLQKTGKIFALYAKSIQCQAANPEISQAIWTVPFAYPSMVCFVRKRMQSYLSSVEETRYSSISLSLTT